MSSRDQSETAFDKARPTETKPGSAAASAKAPFANSNYPPKARFAETALPHSHRPTSA